ncbi:hypothetical protein [Halodesulfurarchaeum sp.]|uniref:hypothetical protein n=1 Tax=Halodesulfurarchaeum sp. TaxID=1980530 RepID=UPI002FC3E01F
MALIRKHRLFQLAIIAWGVVAFGVMIVTISGNARPFLTPDQLPFGGGPIGGILFVVVFWGLGAAILLLVEKRSWKRAGERAGLSPSGFSWIVGKPDLVGTVDGREVRVRTESRDVGSGDESGSSEQTFTVVETTLSEPADQALILTGGAVPRAGMENLPANIDGQMMSLGDIAVLGESEDFARDILTPRAREAMQGLEPSDGVHVGKTADIYAEALREAGGTLAGSVAGLMETKFADRMIGDAETVGTDRKGVVLDGAEIERRAQAVAAIANGFEDASESVSGS